MHGGDIVAQVLESHGVRFLFTLCGGHISPLLTGAKARGIRVIDVRHEATAVFAADAVARLSGVPGVAAVTAGPGVTNTLTALKNAQLAQSPLVLLGGAVPTALHGRGALQDIDQKSVVAPHVKQVKVIRRLRELASGVDQALRLARSGIPGPVFVECPVDLLYDPATVRRWYAEAGGKGRSLVSWYLRWHVHRLFSGVTTTAPSTAPVVVPRASPLKVAEALEKAERPLMVIGSQAVALAADAGRIAEAVTRLGVPVYLSGMARGLLGVDHPLQMRHQRRNALRESDCVVLCGVPCDFRLDYGKHIRPKATLIAANRSRHDATLNRRPTHLVLGDAGLFLQDLELAAGATQFWDSWVKSLRVRDQAREAEIREQSASTGSWINPLALLSELEKMLGESSVLVADGGDFVATAAYILKPRTPLSWLDPGAFGTLGVGAGFALGAALCRPDAEVWMILGDGASGYSLTEFDTFVRHGLPVIALIGNDASWSQIAREQVKILGDDVGTVLARTAYHEVARGFGAQGLIAKSPGEVAQVLSQARQFARQGQPVVINAWLDKADFREGSLSM